MLRAFLADPTGILLVAGLISIITAVGLLTGFAGGLLTFGILAVVFGLARFFDVGARLRGSG